MRDLIPGEGAVVEADGLGIMYQIVGEQTGGALALLEVTLGAGLLGAPPHMHWNEDEVSCVLEGELVVQVGERVVHLKRGETIFKPRGVFHAFWNPGSGTTRFLEFVAPAGFEAFFCEMAPLVSAEGVPDAEGIVALAKRYQVEFDLSRVPELLQQHGVKCSWLEPLRLLAPRPCQRCPSPGTKSDEPAPVFSGAGASWATMALALAPPGEPTANTTETARGE